jgi:uncharacterized repeat protein (TIGR03803 family)
MSLVNRSCRRVRSRSRAALCEALESRVLLSAGPYTFSSVAGFQGKTNGTQPQGLVLDADTGDFYGVTAKGGQYNYGTVFKIAAGTTTILTLASFAPSTQADPDNGLSPRGTLVRDDDGNLFGITTGGGLYNKGTIWEVPATASSMILTLASFDGVNGSYPYSGLVADGAGNLFGTTLGAKKKGYASTVFEFTVGATANALTTLATFSYKEQVGSLATDASGLLAVDEGGSIFGTTERGGTKKLGTLFEISSNHALTTLVSFVGKGPGTIPDGTLLMNAPGDFVGLATSGGRNGHGSIFEFFATSSTLTTLASFRGSNGSHPLGTLIRDASGNYFGTTSLGGSKDFGTVFEYFATSSTITTLYSFRGPTTGAYPTGPLVLDAAGNIWGTTFMGGKNKDKGSVFALLNNVHIALWAFGPPSVINTTSNEPPVFVAGERFILIAKIRDAGGDFVPVANGQLTVKVLSGPRGAKLNGTRTVSLTNGVATFSDLLLKVPGVYTLEISGNMLTSFETDPFTVTLATV